MLTPQEMQEKRRFERAVFGGYSMQAVDQFLELVAKDYSELFRENATLKSQQKVILDRLDEYHRQEDSMNKAMIAAQQAADELVAETERKCARMLSDSEALLRKRKEELQQELDEDALRVAQVRETASEYIGEIQLQLQRCQTQLERIRATLGENTTIQTVPRSDRTARVPNTNAVSTNPEPVQSSAIQADEIAQIINGSMGAETAPAVDAAVELDAPDTDSAEEHVPVQHATAPLEGGKPMPVGEAARRNVEDFAQDITHNVNSVLEKIAIEREQYAAARAAEKAAAAREVEIMAAQEGALAAAASADAE